MGGTRTHVNRAPVSLIPPAHLATPEDGALLSWIHQSAPFGVITLNRSLQVQSWNHWMEIHSGWPAREVLNKDLFHLFPDLQERKLGSHFERTLEGESLVLSSALHQYLLALPSPFRDGGRRHMLQTARLAPLFGESGICGIVILIEDVTQRESQADALRRQHRRDQTLSWALVHLLKLEEPGKTVRQLFFKIAEHLDFDTFCLYLREPGAETFGLTAAGGVPTTLESDFAVCPFVAPGTPELRELVVLNGIQHHPESAFPLLKQAGLTAAVIVPLLADKLHLGFLCFASTSREFIAKEESDLLTTIGRYLAIAMDRENTSHELRRTQEQLSDHAQQLEQKVKDRTRRLEETVAELETFTYTVAHDLKAPIRGMSGYTSILLNEMGSSLPAPAHNIVQKLARTTHRMETLAKDLLAFSKVSREDIALARIELEPLLEDLLAVRSAAVNQAVEIQRPLPAVLGQKDMLQQVMANLIDNAIKFVPPQANPRVRISSEYVAESSPNTRPGTLLFSSHHASLSEPPPNSNRARVRIWVTDQGIGIPPELFQKIFGIFERGVISSAYEGTGIGLAIVARAMQRMGGTCGVESELGKGSRFWIELPAA